MSNENTSTESLHSKQWFHEEEISMFSVWFEMTLDIDLSVGGWFYL